MSPFIEKILGHPEKREKRDSVGRQIRSNARYGVDPLIGKGDDIVKGGLVKVRFQHETLTLQSNLDYPFFHRNLPVHHLESLGI